MKRIVSIFLMLCILIGGSLIVNAEVLTDQEQIKNLFESFYSEYELAFDLNEYKLVRINKYFDNTEQATIDQLLIQTMLKRKILISQNHDIGLEEINKEFDYKYNFLELTNDSAYMQARVMKSFNYASSIDIDSSVGELYNIHLVRKNNEWVISSIDGFVDEILGLTLSAMNVDLDDFASLKKYNTGLDKEVKNLYKRLKESQVNNVQTLSAITTGSYNGLGAASYALQYALNYNTAYADFNGAGGDCTNFISQAIHEGGGMSEHIGS